MLFQFTKKAADNPNKIIALSIYCLSLGKSLKKIIFEAIYCHLCDNDLLSVHQSGFRPGGSTINQLLAITHRIYSRFEELTSEESRTVFLDLSKAFDRVWHEGLSYKLECSGIPGNLPYLIFNFLSDHEQRVLLNGKSSEWERVSAGVPQGSVLGPLFSLVYINDIVEDITVRSNLLPTIFHLFPLLKARLELLMI